MDNPASLPITRDDAQIAATQLCYATSQMNRVIAETVVGIYLYNLVRPVIPGMTPPPPATAEAAAPARPDESAQAEANWIAREAEERMRNQGQ